MRRLLHHFLLLALLFNTVVGVPLHAAEHLHGPAHEAHHQHAHEPVHIQAFLDGTAPEQACAHEHEPGHPHEHHAAHAGTCVWCPHLAQLAAALPVHAALAPPALAHAPVLAPAAGWTLAAQARRCSHPARAPPSMS